MTWCGDFKYITTSKFINDWTGALSLFVTYYGLLLPPRYAVYLAMPRRHDGRYFTMPPFTSWFAER